nr:hypothetical protein [Tanacetum cinerariifolium]
MCFEAKERERSEISYMSVRMRGRQEYGDNVQEVKDKPTNVVKDKVDVVKAPVAKEKENADIVKNGGFM